MSCLDGDSGNGVVVADGKFDMGIDDESLGDDVSIGFLSVDEDLVVSPDGECVDLDQEFSVKSVFGSSEIDFELNGESVNLESQSGSEF